MSKFKIEISSVPDRENLVAEIWYNEILVAEINQETKKLEIEFYLNEKIIFGLDDFFETLETAKRKIMKE
jgi:small basic protein